MPQLQTRRALNQAAAGPRLKPLNLLSRCWQVFAVNALLFVPVAGLHVVVENVLELVGDVGPA